MRRYKGANAISEKPTARRDGFRMANRELIGLINTSALIANDRRNLLLELNPSSSWVSKPRAGGTIHRMTFPAPVPEIPAANVDKAAAYYVNTLGFTSGWGDDQGGIAGISRGNCRLFITNQSFRDPH